MAEEVGNGLEVLRVLLEIEVAREMPELVRRHMQADMLADRLHDLNGQGLLGLGLATVGDEERAIWVGAEARHDLAPIPADAGCHVFGQLEGELALLALR